jgi:hypothetical protein
MAVGVAPLERGATGGDAAAQGVDLGNIHRT